MGLLENIRQYMFRRSLHQRLAARQRQRGNRPVSLLSAKSAGVFFDATDVDQRQIALRFANALKEQGKQVKLLAYFDADVSPADFAFPSFTRKQLDWARRPQSTELDQFLDGPYEMFFCLRTRADQLSDLVAVLVNASLKVGPVSGNPTAYDIMIDTGATTKLDHFIRQMQGILEQTHVEYQPA